MDLEDRLLYGLTPQRLAILAGAVLVAAAMARHGTAGWILAVPVVAVGVGCAWLKPLGRSPDAWALAAMLYVVRNHRLELDRDASAALWHWAGRRSQGWINRRLVLGSEPRSWFRSGPRPPAWSRPGGGSGSDLRLIEGGRR